MKQKRWMSVIYNNLKKEAFIKGCSKGHKYCLEDKTVTYLEMIFVFSHTEVTDVFSKRTV